MSNTVDFSQYEEKPALKIFNGGNAGCATNVQMSIVANEKTKDTAPDAHVVFIDSEGATLRSQGIWNLAPGADQESVKKTVQATGRFWRACMGETTAFPTGLSVVQVYEAIANSGKTFDVFVAYGTTDSPSKYLKTRKYDYIQAHNPSKPLVAKTDDLMVRPQADTETETTTNTAVESELPF